MAKFEVGLAGIILTISGFATLSTSKAIGAEDGSALFSSKCAMCHAKDGKGNQKMADKWQLPLSALDLTDKETKDKSDQDLYNTASRGKNKMPSYADKLTPDQLSSVISYIRSLK